jgi:hypothetical protein
MVVAAVAVAGAGMLLSALVSSFTGMGPSP